MSEHVWFEKKFIAFPKPLTCCRLCGIIKRADGKNKPCRGPVKVGLRDQPSMEP